MNIQSNCDNCGELYVLKKRKENHRFCGSKCRKANHRRKTGKDNFIQVVTAERAASKTVKSLIGILPKVMTPTMGEVRGESPVLTRLYTERRMLVQRLNQINIQSSNLGFLLGATGAGLGYAAGSKKNPLTSTIVGGIVGNLVGRMIDTGNQDQSQQLANQTIKSIKYLDGKIAKERSRLLVIPKQISTSIQTSVKPKNPYYNAVESKDMVKGNNSLELTGKWRYFLGYLPNKFSALIYGLPKQGKTHLCLQMANYLNNDFGKVLYISAEEGSEDPFVEKYNSYDSKFVVVDEVKGGLGVASAIDDYKPKFVFIDSITRIGLTVEDVKKFKDAYPNVHFFYIVQATKGGRFRGSLELEHEVTSTIEVKQGVAVQRGRTVNGETEVKVIENWISN